jgi:hypothetical protein
LDLHVAELSKQIVPADKRHTLGCVLGKIAKEVGPTPKKGAKRMFQQAELFSFYNKRKRLIVLDGEAPDPKPRSTWSEYFRLARAAAALRFPEDGQRRHSVETNYLRRLIDAGTSGANLMLDGSDFDISDIIFGCALKIQSRVLADVPELDRAWRLPLIAPENFFIPACSVDVPLGALEWSVEIDAFHFPDELIKQCPRILLEGNLWWEDPNKDEQAAIFDSWLGQFNSPIGLPEVDYDPALGYGWRRQTVTAYEHVSLTIEPRYSLAAAKLSLNGQSSPWDVAVQLHGLTSWQPVFSGQSCDEISPYVKDIVAGHDVYDYREDDFTLPVDDFWGTNFPVLHCIAPVARQPTANPSFKAAKPFIVDANDPSIKPLEEHERHLLLEEGRNVVDIRSLELMRSRWNGRPPRFIPNFFLDESEPVPAPEDSFAAALLRNIKHADRGNRLDYIAVTKAKLVAQEVIQKLKAAVSLIEKYRDGLAD